ISIFASHRSPAHFEDPEKFNPDRWSPENAEKIPHFAYLPFSTGPRNCIGQVFAQFEAKVVMARFLKTFDVRLCPGQTRAIKQEGTISPRDGAVCTLLPL
ncbi:cholesterol 24-hydroxylase, partial [Exaiptasia diaphana]